MIAPAFLRKGDTIAIIGAAGKIDPARVATAQNKLRDWGLEVILGRHLYDNSFQFAADDNKRLADFQEMLDNDEVRAILCARGGYGLIRIIDRLDFTQFCKNPKWIIGFSDITVIHSHVHTQFGIATIHGTMAGGFDLRRSEPAIIESLRKALFGELTGYQIKHHQGSRKGAGEGELVGGNLAILCSLLGSRSDIDAAGKVLFIEETGEYPYRIDRMIWSLKRAGKFSELAGLIVGGITDMPSGAAPFGKTPYEIVLEAASGYDYPVCLGFPAGHIRDNRALIMGRRVQLSVGKDTHLDFTSS